MRKRNIIFILILIVFGLILVGISIGLGLSIHLIVTEYNVHDDNIESSLSICQLSDLHCKQYGNNNSKLLENISSADPDLILMTGDMISNNSSEDDIKDLCELISKCVQIAPIYYSLGNHEIEFMEKNGESLLDDISASGAVILDQTYVEIEINGQMLRIGGAYGYLLSHKYRSGDEQQFMDNFLDTQLPTILLSHMSEGLLAYGCIQDWDVDYVFSGHAHGGQIRLPIIGGLYDPETGWFPKYSKGIFEIDNSNIILSAGLGSAELIPRFGNPPEIILLRIN